MCLNICGYESHMPHMSAGVLFIWFVTGFLLYLLTGFLSQT